MPSHATKAKKIDFKYSCRSHFIIQYHANPMDTFQIIIDAPNNDNLDPTFVTRQFYQSKTACFHLKFYYNESNDIFTVQCNTISNMYTTQYKFTKFCRHNHIKKHSNSMSKALIQSIKIIDVLFDDLDISVQVSYSFINTQLTAYDNDINIIGKFEIIFHVGDRLKIIWNKPDHAFYCGYPEKHIINKFAGAKTSKVPDKYKLLVFVSNDTIYPVLFDGLQIYEPFEFQFSHLRPGVIKGNVTIDELVGEIVGFMKLDKHKILGAVNNITVSQIARDVVGLQYRLFNDDFMVDARYNIFDSRFI